jgi:hypothetical protein
MHKKSTKETEVGIRNARGFKWRVRMCSIDLSYFRACMDPVKLLACQTIMDSLCFLLVGGWFYFIGFLKKTNKVPSPKAADATSKKEKEKSKPSNTSLLSWATWSRPRLQRPSSST